MNVTRLPIAPSELPCFLVEVSTGSIMLMNEDDEVLFEYHPDFGTVRGAIDGAPTEGKIRVNLICGLADELQEVALAWASFAESGSLDRPPLPTISLCDGDGAPFISPWT